MPQLSCAAAEETGYPGSLMICVTSSVGFFPVVGATVTISDSDSPEQILETLTTDESGQTTSVLLPAPNPAYSQSPSNPRPYTDYMIEVQADGYDPVRINGAEILPDESSILPVSMTPTASSSRNISSSTTVFPTIPALQTTMSAIKTISKTSLLPKSMQPGRRALSTPTSSSFSPLP